MPRKSNQLTVVSLKKKLRHLPGRHNDGRGLHLYVQRNGSASFIFRYRDRRTSKLRDKGLGAYEDVTLEQARLKAEACRALLREGKDPIDSHKDNVRQRKTAHASRLTFFQCFERHYEIIKDGWRNKKHAAQWRSTITTHCKRINDLPVQEVTTSEVVDTLRTIWLSHPETGRRVRQRIEAVVDWAKANGRYIGDNPATLKGHLDKLLAKQPKAVKHRPAVHHSKIAAFMASVEREGSLSSKALLLQVATATRPNEAVNARWEEFNLDSAEWIIPGNRMKAKVAHVVPLPKRTVEMLRTHPRDSSGLLFPGVKGKAMTTAAVLKLVKKLHPEDPEITSHGFRSTFRDWAGAISSHPSDVAEAALAHVKSDKTEAAYFRDQLLSKRRTMMQDWEDFYSDGMRKANS